MGLACPTVGSVMRTDAMMKKARHSRPPQSFLGGAECPLHCGTGRAGTCYASVIRRESQVFRFCKWIDVSRRRNRTRELGGLPIGGESNHLRGAAYSQKRQQSNLLLSTAGLSEKFRLICQTP